MQDTRDIQLTSNWLAIAGPGHATVTPHHQNGDVFWAVGATQPAASLRGHILLERQDRAFQMDAGMNLWVRATGGAVDRWISVSREADPV